MNDLKYRMTLIDEDAVVRLREEKKAVTVRAEKAERKESILNLFIRQGYDAQCEFAKQRGRYKMTDTESFRIYYSILAIAVRDKLTIAGSASAKSAAQRFLGCCSWVGTTEYQQELHSHWTEQFAEKAGFPDDAVQNFIAFVDEMSCSADIYVSLSGPKVVLIRSAFMDALLAKNSRIGMAQRNKVWLHQRRRKVVECQGNFVYLPCPKLGVGETCIGDYSNL